MNLTNPKLLTALRILFGTVLFIGTLDKLHLMGRVPAQTAYGEELMDIIFNIKYLPETMGLTQMLCAILILANRYMPITLLATLAFTGPIMAYTLLFNFANLLFSQTPALAVFVPNLCLIYHYRYKYYPSLFQN